MIRIALVLSLLVGHAAAWAQLPARAFTVSFQLIDAAGGPASRDTAIAGLATVLRLQTQLTAFRLVERAEERTDSAGHAMHGFANVGSTIDVQVSDYQVSGTRATVHIAFQWKYPSPAIDGRQGKSGIVRGSMVVPIGHLVALTNTFTLGSQPKAIILTIRLE